MKEQKELIKAALEVANQYPEGSVPHSITLRTLVKAAKAYRQAQEQPERRKAPWTDSEGNELFEGDVIRISNGEELVVFCHDTREIWGAKNNKSGERFLLFFMIEDFQAVKVSP